MPYEQKDPDKLKWQGLWLREKKNTGDKFYAGMTLNQEAIDQFIEFVKKPSKMMIFSNTFKKTDRHPDASVFLYHIDENWKPQRQPAAPKEEPKPTPEPEQEETPF